MGGFFYLLVGGLVGYHFAKEKNDHSQAWACSWGESRRRALQSQMGTAPAPPVDTSHGKPKEEQPQAASAAPYRPWMGWHGIEPQDWTAFQQWKELHSQPANPSQQHGTAPVPTAQASPQYYLNESVKASAVENADKALDALLVQVSSLKEKLGQYKSSTPSTPTSEKGDYKLV